MIELRGKYNTVSVYTDNIEPAAISQIIELCNQEFIKGSKIRIMPDTHAGSGCIIGTSMTVSDKIVPSLVGSDIGCGMLTVKLGKVDIDFSQLDNIIREYIPFGADVFDTESKQINKTNIEKLKCYKDIKSSACKCSFGTLGGGNHFIEVDKDSEDNLYLVIHSGSRMLGGQVFKYYQRQAVKDMTNIHEQVKQIANKYIAEGKQHLIPDEIKKIKPPIINPNYAYLTNDSLKDYLHDMNITQEFADYNRQVMANVIITKLKLKVIDKFSTIHNYIDIKNNILRKGAISAQKGERVLIPINMKDGAIIGIGKGNSEWNYSAPHGAGRILSRSEAKELVDFDEYQKVMDGIWTSSVNINTIDESPMAYKSIDEIIENVQDTIDIIDIIKPVYNFKAS